MDKEKLINRIKALFELSKGESKLGNEEASNTAAKKAQDLLTKYNLEKVNLNNDKDDNDIDKITLAYKDLSSKIEGKYLSTLSNIVSRYNYCMAVIDSSTKDIWVFGKPHNREVVKFLIESLNTQIKSLEKFAWKEYDGYDKRNKFKRGYLLGICSGLRTRLRENQEKQVQHNSQVQALVRDQEGQVNEYISKNLHVRSARRSRGTSSHDGMNKGLSDSNKININPGINSSPSGNKMLR